MRKKLKEVIYEIVFNKVDSMSLFCGILIGNLAWGLQPDFSQGISLVRSGMNEPFFLIGILALFFMFIIFCAYAIPMFRF